MIQFKTPIKVRQRFSSLVFLMFTAVGIIAPLGATPSASATTLSSPTPKTCEAIFGSSPGESKNQDNGPTAKELKLARKIRKDAAAYFQRSLKLPENDAAAQLQLVMEGDLSVATPVTVKDIVKWEPQSAEIARNKVLNAYVTLSKQMGRTPTAAEVAGSLSLKTEELDMLMGPEGLFLNLDGVRKAAIAKKPKSFERVVDTAIFTPERTALMTKAINERKRLIVTTAVAGTPIHKEFFQTLVTAAKEMDAEILVFPANMQTTGLDPVLLNTPGVHILLNSVELTPWLHLNNIKLTAKQINPLMGLDRYGPRGQIQIVGSPKFELRTVPTFDNDLRPHFLVTTGAVTEAIYNGEKYIQERTNALATDKHVLGALVLEKSQAALELSLPGNPNIEGFYHFRHIEFRPEARGFTDRNTFYTAQGSRPAKVEALTYSDVHVGVTDPNYVKAMVASILALDPSWLVTHDLFNGHTVNKHERMNLISNAIKYKDGKLDLEQELRSVVVFLNSLLSINPKLKIAIIDSNHNAWLNRWLNEAQFIHEAHNRALGFELAAVMVKGESPLQYALEKFGLEYPKRVFIMDSDSWKVSGVELAQHGHAGANGAKGSLQSFARAADRVVYGHSHTSQRTGHTVNVGTATYLKQDYNQAGASSWSQSFAAITESGEIQLYILRNGEWWSETLPAGATGDGFFPQGYPKVIPNAEPGVGLQVDQYSNRD